MRLNYLLSSVVLCLLLLSADTATACSCFRAKLVITYKSIMQDSKDSAVFVGKALSYKRVSVSRCLKG